MIAKRLLIMGLCLAGFSSGAQNYELGKVSVAELAQKKHPADSTASAAVLYKKARTYLDYNKGALINEIEVRIKIYDKDGLYLANFEQPYISGNEGQVVKITDAATYNLVDGQIQKTKLGKESEFVDKKMRFLSVKKITLPNVKEGSVIEYKCQVSNAGIDEFYFQGSIPVNFVQYRVQIPAGYNFSTRFKGYIDPTVKEDVEFTNNVKEHWTTYTLTDVKAMKEEGYVNNIDNYRAAVTHELMSINTMSGVRKISTDWETIANRIYKSDRFGGQFDSNNYFKRDVDSLINGVTDRDEKIRKIFRFVQSRITWNNYLGYHCDEGLKTCYKQRTGNIADINLLLTAMLRYAGFSANPILVSTRDNGIARHASLNAYNYVIVGVELPNDLVFLDASDKFSSPNILPLRVLNWRGRIIRENGSSAEVDLMPKVLSKDIVSMVAAIDDKGNVTGKIKDQYHDYNAFLYRVGKNDISNEVYLERLEKKLEGVEISDYKSTEEADKPVTETYSFVHSSASEIIGGKIYFSPLLFFAEKQNPFKQEKREYPVDFSFPYQDKYQFTIAIPEGYAVESVPEPIAVEMLNNLGSFTFNITATPKQIQLVASMAINQAIIGAQDYDTLKNFYKAIVDKENERIILKKI